MTQDADTSAEAVDRRCASLSSLAAALAHRLANPDLARAFDDDIATLRALAAERDALQEVVDVRTMIGTARLEEDRDRLAAENARLREALKFYANPEVYKPHPHGPAFDRRDLSFHARAALGDTRND